MKSYLLRSIGTLVLVACAAGSAHAQVPDPTFDNPREEAAATRDGAERSSTFLGARPGLEFSPSTTSLIAVNFSAAEKENGNVVTLSLAPFRAANQSRPTWGFSILASSNSEKAITEIGAGYRFQWRWLLQAAYTNGAERAYEGIQAQFSNENHAIAVWKGSLEDIDSTLTVYRNRVKAHQDSLITEWCQGDCQIIQTHLARLLSGDTVLIDTWTKDKKTVESALAMYRKRVKTRQDSLITEWCQGDCQIIQTHLAALQRYEAHIKELEARRTVLSDSIRDAGTRVTLVRLQQNEAHIKALEARRTVLSDSIRTADARLAKATLKQTVRRLELSWVSLLPVPTVSYFQGFFAPDSRVKDQEDTANKTFKLNLDWRVGTYAEATISYASSHARASSMADQELIGAESFSATALIFVPELLGTKHYDAVYFKDKFQRGIGFGFTYSVKSCKESGEDRVNCLDEVVDDTLLGAVIDLRITPTVTPRIVIGRRTFEKKMEAEEGTDKDASFEFGVQLAISFGT